MSHDLGEIRAQKGRIAQAVTPDGVELQGFVAEIGDTRTVLLHIHGQYENALLPKFVWPLIERVSEKRIVTILADTRARDYVYYFRKYKEDKSFDWVKEGGQYEIFSNCIFDIEGWVNLIGKYYKDAEIVMSGHSHGALKILYYLANSSWADNIKGAILLSPSDDIGIQIAYLGNRYDEAIGIAQEYVGSGNAETLMPDWTYTQPISAKMYLDMFGSDSKLAIVPYYTKNENAILKSIKCDVFLAFGENDAATSSLSSRDAVKFVESRLVNAKSIFSLVAEQSDHHYRGKEDYIALQVARWIGEI